MAAPKKVENFRYIAKYSALIKPLVSEAKDKYLAEASMKEIAKYIPANVDQSTNIDLLPFACNAFVANRVNKNDDVSDGPTSVSLARLFVNKPVNIEHNRSKVMGVILSYAFTKFGSDEPLSEKEAIASKEPFNVTLGGILWRVVNPDIANIIESSSDPASDNFETISASWEVGFMDYALATIDGDSKNLADATMITDPDEIKKLSPHLRSAQGKGVVDKGVKLYRVVTQGSLPLGIGLTESPAADVKGVATQASKEPVKDTSKASEVETEMPVEAKATQENVETISQTEKINVIQERTDIMSFKITKIEDLTDENLKQIAASELGQWVKEQLGAANAAYVAEKNKLEKDVATAKEEAKKLQESQTSVQTELKKVQDALAAYETKEKARAKQDAFNSRMTTLDSEFNLTDADRGVITSDIADLDDAAYATYKKKIDVLLEAKKKTAQAAAPVVAAPVVAVAQVATASTVTTDAKVALVNSAIDNAQKGTPVVPVTSTPDEPSVLNKYAKAFGVDQWISSVKLD